MIRFTVLNEEKQTKSQEEESVEIQAEKCLGVYQSAIRKLQLGRVEQAKELLENLISSDLFQMIDNESEIAARGTPARLLQYLVYTNYASILEDENSLESAVEFYLKAMSCDESDNTVWIKIGDLAIRSKKLRLARYALECGLQRGNHAGTGGIGSVDFVRSDHFDQMPEGDLTPSQWRCLESLCNVLFDIGDYSACQKYIHYALRVSPYFDRGQELLEQVEQKLSLSEIKTTDLESDIELEAALSFTSVMELTLDDLAWVSLGKVLMDAFLVAEQDTGEKFYNRRVKVSIGSVAKEGEDVQMEAASPNEESAVKQDKEGKVSPIIKNPVATDNNSTTESTTPVLGEEAGDSGQCDDVEMTKDDAANTEKDSIEIEQGVSVKRKRRDAEERFGLRTSKRVRDKLDQFEVTKRKREEEDFETLAKYRIALAKFGLDLEHATVQPRGGDPEQETVFPNGLSRLLSITSSHFEQPISLVNASTVEVQQKSKTNHFAIFTGSRGAEATASGFEDLDPLQTFIDYTNSSNSGIIEYLRDFVFHVFFGCRAMSDKSLWQLKWPSGLKEVVYKTIGLIEDHLLDFLSRESGSDDVDKLNLDSRARIELLLSVCELHLDQMVITIMTPATTIKRGRALKKPDLDLQELQAKNFRRWLFHTKLGLQSISLDMGMEGSLESVDTWILEAMLRLNWMMGRRDQCAGDAVHALEWFSECQKLVKIDPNLTIRLPNCQYDPIIDANIVAQKVERIKTNQYVLDAERLFEEKDYTGVITRLETFLLQKGANISDKDENAMDEGVGSPTAPGTSISERLGLMETLYRSCKALGQHDKQLQCALRMFTDVSQTLVDDTTEETEPTVLWFLFTQINQTLALVRDSLQSGSTKGMLSNIEHAQVHTFLCCLLAVARLCFVNLMHQDRLVDESNTTYLDLLRNRPHIDMFNLMVIRVWLVLLLVLPCRISDLENDHPTAFSPKSMEWEGTEAILAKPLTTNSLTPIKLFSAPTNELYLEVVALVHDDLGTRDMCGNDNGALIRHALQVMSSKQGRFYRREESQCYYCIYGISISVDGEFPVEHESKPIDFERDAAIEFFPMLEKSLTERALRGQIKSDLKDALDRLEEALGDPPYATNAVLAMNKALIEEYLGSEINFADAIDITAQVTLPTMSLPSTSKLPEVFKKFYLIQGRIYWSQFKNRAKNNQFKPIEDLQHAIDQFRTHLCVYPNSWESWYLLARCYSSLADENLVFSAADINNNYTKIQHLQRKAFLCFSQAAKLAPKWKQNKEEKALDMARHKKVHAVRDETMKSDSNQSKAVKKGFENDRAQEESQEEDEAMGGDDDDAQDTEEPLQQVSGVSTGVTEDDEWFHQQSGFWYDFGYLVHGVMSRPMRMEAMKRTNSLETVISVAEKSTIDIPEPTEIQMYKFAAFCFRRSMLLNQHSWRAPFMLAKCMEKLNGPPDQVLALYRMSSEHVPARSGQPGNEKIFEVAYRMVSTLSKYLKEGKITPAVVRAHMKRARAKSRADETISFEIPASERAAERSDYENERLEAFRSLCEGIAIIKHSDKKRWHHRPIYRQAWILYHIYRDAEMAKAELLNLFHLKTNVKTLMSNVWKPEFERGGKHFVYVGEYVLFLILLAKETNDIETLNTLARKIRKATGLLLDLKEVWQVLYDAYLELLGRQVGPEPVPAVAEVIPRMEFREKAGIYESRILEQEPKPEGLILLQRLNELKKLNERLAPEGMIAHHMATCYSKLFVEFGGLELYPKELLANEVGKEAEGSKTIIYDSQGNSDGSTTTADETGLAQEFMERASIDHDNGNISTIDQSLASVPRIVIDSSNMDAQPSKSSNQTSIEKNKDVAIAVTSKGEGSDSVPSLTLQSSEKIIVEPTSLSATPASSQTTATSDTPVSVISSPSAEYAEWKSRKKISISEIASRATAICKAPTPSLKAPATVGSVNGTNTRSQRSTASTLGGMDKDKSNQEKANDAENEDDARQQQQSPASEPEFARSSTGDKGAKNGNNNNNINTNNGNNKEAVGLSRRRSSAPMIVLEARHAEQETVSKNDSAKLDDDRSMAVDDD